MQARLGETFLKRALQGLRDGDAPELPELDGSQAPVVLLHGFGVTSAVLRPLEARIRLAAIARGAGMETKPSDAPPAAGIAGIRAYFNNAAGTAARYLARADGPRVGARPVRGAARRRCGGV